MFYFLLHLIIIYYYLKFIYLEDKYVLNMDFIFYVKSNFYYYNMDF